MTNMLCPLASQCARRTNFIQHHLKLISAAHFIIHLMHRSATLFRATLSLSLLYSSPTKHCASIIIIAADRKFGLAKPLWEFIGEKMCMQEFAFHLPFSDYTLCRARALCLPAELHFSPRQSLLLRAFLHIHTHVHLNPIPGVNALTRLEKVRR